MSGPRRRYRFGPFVLSPTRRVLLRDGAEVPLIPRYLDLLLLLVERRAEAVHRREILDAVWSDVVVSDGALSQAVRTLRRALGDDSREPVYVRTVSRHGYRFVFDGVVEEPEEGPVATGVPRGAGPESPSAGAAPPGPSDPFDAAIARLLGADGGDEHGNGEAAREAAETLHALGTAEALRRLDARPGFERGVALLRDARWNVPGAGEVPLLGRPGGWKAVWILVGLRLSDAARLAGSRWGAAAGGGAAAGAIAGVIGGLVIRAASVEDVSARLPAVLALVGALLGALGAAGVGAGLAAAESLARSGRGAALVLLGATGGGGIGLLAHSIGLWTLEGIFGHSLSPVGGVFEGVMIGGAAGFGYALATPRPGGGGMATPRGGRRLLAAAITGLCCAAAGVAVHLLGGHLGGVSLDVVARSFEGSQFSLRPLSLLFGEIDPGPVTRTVLGAWEGLLFGVGLVLGLTRRPRPGRS